MNFKASMFLSGVNKSKDRQQIIFLITGKNPPKSKATLGACINSIIQVYTQPTLF